MAPPRTRIVPLGLAVKMALVATLPACGQEEPPPELPPRAIQWARVAEAVGGELRVISGIVTAIDDTSLAFEVGGTVDKVYVNLGDIVEQGQEVARLDPEPLELAISDAEAALAEAAALRQLARSTFSRYLEAGAAVARQEVDRARAMRAARETQVQAAEARLDLARRDLRRSVLVAPFRGAISSRLIEPAMTIAPGEPAFELDSAEGGLRVEVQLPETLIARVRQGDEATVQFPVMGDAGVDVADPRVKGVVSEVGTRAGAGNAFPVRVDLIDPPRGLRPGMTAEVSFVLKSMAEGLGGMEGFVIPIAAVLPEEGDTFSVFVFDEETSTVHKRPVQPGGVRDNAIAVLGGLESDDIIATAGVSFLREGQEVTLLAEELMRTAP